MIKLSDEQIKDIAQELEIGMSCFVNKKTGELKSIPEELIDEEEWQDIIDEIENNSENFIEVENMDSHESYNLMLRFVDTVEDKQLSIRLNNALNGQKPFHTFRYELNYSDEYLDKWYEYKSRHMISWVKDQLYPDISK